MSDGAKFVRRPAPPTNTSSGKGAVKPKRKYTDGHVSAEGRQRLSELAKRRHEAGGFAKSADGSRATQKRSKKPSRSRVAQMVAEAALERRNAQAIIDVFRDGIHPHQPITIRLKAAEAWLRVESEEAKQQLREQSEDSVQKTREELLSTLSEKLSSSHAGMLVRKQLESQIIPDAEVVEDVDQSSDT